MAAPFTPALWWDKKGAAFLHGQTSLASRVSAICRQHGIKPRRGQTRENGSASATFRDASSSSGKKLRVPRKLLHLERKLLRLVELRLALRKVSPRHLHGALVLHVASLATGQAHAQGEAAREAARARAVHVSSVVNKGIGQASVLTEQ